MRYAQGGGLTDAERTTRERLRLQAVERFESGQKSAEVAAALRISVRSVERWRRAWREGGEDEAGQSMAPPRARTWGRIGQTPVVRVRGRGTGRVSMAGMTCYEPGEPSRLIYAIREYRGRKDELTGFEIGNLAAADSLRSPEPRNVGSRGSSTSRTRRRLPRNHRPAPGGLT
nr:helix-turn-helix domain-containing protein [Streptomyces sp. MBT33]